MVKDILTLDRVRPRFKQKLSTPLFGHMFLTDCLCLSLGCILAGFVGAETVHILCVRVCLGTAVHSCVGSSVVAAVWNQQCL